MPHKLTVCCQVTCGMLLVWVLLAWKVGEGMQIIRVDQSNIDREHICCAISDSKGDSGVQSKKAWMQQRFAEGLTFQKLDARGKVFIEYIPAESAWCPIIAEGYMFINCFWVSGQYKGQGYANQLLDRCIGDAQALGMKGLVALSSAKKMPFLSDPKYLKHKGFRVSDTAAPYFELLYLPFSEQAEAPVFRDCAKNGRIADTGFMLFYSDQCPHTAKYAPLIAHMAREQGVEFKLVHLQTSEEAQQAPTPFTTYGLFHNGEFITNEILSEKKFAKLLEESSR